MDLFWNDQIVNIERAIQTFQIGKFAKCMDIIEFGQPFLHGQLSAGISVFQWFKCTILL